MGVYIKGMEMPTGELGAIPVMIYADGCIEHFFSHKKLGTAISVPPHGSLIDTKSLENMHFTESMYDKDSKLFVPFVEVASAIFDAPTIIPEEPAEDES